VAERRRVEARLLEDERGDERGVDIFVLGCEPQLGVVAQGEEDAPDLGGQPVFGFVYLFRKGALHRQDRGV
jgi:hypothetical protein